MTKDELVNIIQTNLAGGNVTPDIMGKFHGGDIEKYIEIAYHQMLSELKDADIDAYLGQITKTLETADGSKAIPVSYDEDLEIYYIDLPVSLAPMGKKAIRLITPAKDLNSPFAIIETDAVPVFNELVDKYDDTISCYRQGDRVEFANYKKGVTHVQIRAIPSFSNLDDDDEIYLPGGKPKYIFDLVIGMYQPLKATPEDQKNDNSSNIAE